MKIKNWSKFQHFKDRRPPWVKLYRDLLDDMEWHQLDPLASKVLVTLWLLASEDENQDGQLPDIKTIAWRLRLTEKQVSECVSKLSHWLEQDGITVISDGYHDDMPETETETETKKERETKTEPPEGVSSEILLSFVKHRKSKKAQITPLVLESIKKEAQKAGWTMEAALTEIVVRNWQSFKADWVSGQVTQAKAAPVSFAQQAADIARTTVPSRINRDPSLVQLEEDFKKAVPMPDSVRQALSALTRKVSVSEVQNVQSKTD
jgi:hypothetical protein